LKLSPRNWREFQHYSGRCPPWIRLHRKLLDDYEFHSLPLASRALAPLLWLIASEQKDGCFDADYSKLAFRVRSTATEVEQALKPLIEANFFHEVDAASRTLAEGEQDATPEESRSEGDTEAEGERASALPDGLDFDAWNRWKDYRSKIRKPLKPVSVPAAQRKLAAFGSDQAAVVEQSIANGWQGFFPLKTNGKHPSGSIAERLTWRPTE
jgi:hypothetical protein